jgi:hypothetical protein
VTLTWLMTRRRFCYVLQLNHLQLIMWNVVWNLVQWQRALLGSRTSWGPCPLSPLCAPMLFINSQGPIHKATRKMLMEIIIIKAKERKANKKATQGAFAGYRCLSTTTTTT